MRRRLSWIPALLIILMLTGCEGIAWSYRSAIEKMDNEYFKTEVVCVDKAGAVIIKNQLTDEYFVMVAGSYGVTLTPIKVNSTSFVADDEMGSAGMDYGAEDN